MVEMSRLLTSIERAVAAERERCAKIAERKYSEGGWHPAAKNAGLGIAEEIRRADAPSAPQEKER